MIFSVAFKALVFSPEKNEVHDGKVTQVTQEGIYIESGPLKSFISKERIPGDYKYDPNQNMFQSDRDAQRKIKVGIDIRYKIFQTKYDIGDITALSTISEDFLGPVSF